MNLVPVPLAEVFDENRFGGKSVSLGQAMRTGLPVPQGFGIEVALVEAIATSDNTDVLAGPFAGLKGPVAVRSSAVGEDAPNASFAGQHVSVMNLRSADAVVRAVREVGLSARSSWALAYRRLQGVSGPPRIAALMQRMVTPDVAGVMFTRHPVVGEDERIVEAAWGLGEAIVGGLVVPDSFRISRGGAVLERKVGVKDVMLRMTEDGRTETLAVNDGRATELVLSDEQLRELNNLAGRCEDYFGTCGERGLDIEWAIERRSLYLLQCRPITRS